MLASGWRNLRPGWWLALGLSAILPLRLPAQTVSWNGSASTGDWATAANWSSSPSLPLTSDVVGFDADNANAQFSLALGANRSVAGLVFASTGTTGFSFDSSYALTVGASGIVNNNPSTQTFAGLVIAGATSTWSSPAGALAFNNVRLAATLTLSGSSAQSIGGTLTNYGGNRTLTNNTTAGLTVASVALSESNTARTLTLSGTGNTTITGTVSNGGSGNGNLTKSGTGTLTLAAANTHSGNNTLSAGTLVAGHDSAFGTGTLVLGGGTLSGSGARTFANSVTLSGNTILGGASDLTFAGNLTLASTRTLTVNNTGQTTLSNIALSNSATARTLTIAGTGQTTIAGVVSNGLSSASNLTKSGTGTLTLSGANTYSGNTSLTAGTVRAGHDASFGTGALALGTATLLSNGGSRTFANSGTFTGNTTFAGNDALTFTGAFTFTGSRTLTFTNTALTTLGDLALSNSTTARTLTLAGTGAIHLAGVVGNGAAATGNLTKSGTGTLTLSGANTYSGITTLSAGTTILAHDSAFGASTVNLGTATLQADASPRTITNAINLTGNATLAGSSALEFDGNLTLTSSRTLTVTNTAATTFDGTIALSNSTSNRTLTLAGSGDLTLNGPVTNGLSSASGITKTGTGTLTLNGTNTYTGSTALNAGLTVIAAESALGANPATYSSSRLSLNGGTLRTTASFAIDDANRGITLNAGGGTFSPEAGTTLTLQNTIAGTGKLTVNGAGTVILSGTASNSFSGGLTIAAGTAALAKTAALNTTGTGAIHVGDGLGAVASAILRLDADQQISNSVAVTIHSDGRFELNGHTETIGSLAGSGLVDLGGGSLTVGGTASTTFDGTLAGTGNFIKSGSGTLTLGQDQAFTGSLTLAGGTLSLADTSYSFGSLSVTANSIINFAGNTTLSLDSLTVAVGVTLTILNWDEAYDHLVVASFTGASYDLSGVAPMNRITFTGFTANDTRWRSFDDQVTPVPEPGAWGALLLAIAGALLVARRRLTGSR